MIADHPKPGPIPITQMKRCFYGATYLFDEIGKLTFERCEAGAGLYEAGAELRAVSSEFNTELML
ncbi:hypothetical protein E6C55_10100 [Cohnella fermenti]|uniref:Uncharacterized protein n=1 Tax=Cohnella fermenti TaxID=2565925 RepID=A0A4S4BZV8_9BACL|nr:hypothetical protein E6C55_10100 [Cohnella fermenti]